MTEILTVAGLLLGGLIASEIGYRLGLIYGPKYEAFGRQFDIIRGAVDRRSRESRMAGSSSTCRTGS